MIKNSVFIIFPHQLFKQIDLLKRTEQVVLVEEHLYFTQYKFHKQKILLHRASMRYYMDYLTTEGLNTRYIEATTPLHHIEVFLEECYQKGIKEILIFDVCDDWLSRRIQKKCDSCGITLTIFESPLFLNTNQEIESYFDSKKKFLHADFYIQQRKKLSILVDEHNKPVGGKWSFDTENRLKYPKGKIPPKVVLPKSNKYVEEAKQYVEAHFSHHYGQVTNLSLYPITHCESEAWFVQFLQNRFTEFGEYEDAIVDHESILHHSVLSPLLNIGLLTPQDVIRLTLKYAENNPVGLNSLEGFIRQVVGWREYIRGLYVYIGRQQRTTNFWNHTRPIPSSFYTATTGIEPIDQTIRKLLHTGYCHHIERLMLLGNFMLLSEFHPDHVYQWFMELSIDAYDWVMVPNVYGMSQFADGGLMSTKPYISGSSYILKMSNYKKGQWCQTWDGLFWRFMQKQSHFFTSNPRLGMLLKVWENMDEKKKKEHIKHAEDFLDSLI